MSKTTSFRNGSNVGLVLSRKAYEHIVLFHSECSFESADIHHIKNGEHLIIWNNVDWVRANNFVDVIEYWIGCFDRQVYYNLSSKDYLFMRIQYGIPQMILGDKIDNDFNLKVVEGGIFYSENNIEIETCECKCELCGGTGIRDFGFYTRACECKLG